MSYFKAKMQQIQFWLVLCPRPHWGSLQRSPIPLARLKEPISKKREEMGGKVMERGKKKGENGE